MLIYFKKVVVVFLAALAFFIGCAGKNPHTQKYLNVGFDVDDTLLFSPPAFEIAFSSNEQFAVPEENIYFETAGKVQRLKELQIDIYYGDYDTHITAAMEAGAVACRIERSTTSGHRQTLEAGLSHYQRRGKADRGGFWPGKGPSA